jgi:DHA1 family tetracycline resistance protein-like MFS transporter
MPSNQRRAAVPFILFTVFLDVLSMGVIIPVLPNLVLGFSGGATDQAAKVYGWFTTVWALMQFIASPLLGALSDRFGRRPIILISCFGLGCDYLVMANAPSLAWLFVGRMISGIMAAGYPTAIAYVADVTPPQERGAWFGKIGAAWGIGFITGPAIGGFLAAISPRAPFWVAAILTILNAAYGFFILPESLAKDVRRPFSWKRANPVGSLRLLSAHRELLGLSTVYFFLYLAMNVLYTVYVLYAGYRYHWSAGIVGSTLALVGICNVVVQGVLVKGMLQRLGERKALLIGIAAAALGFALYGYAPTGLVFCAAIPVFAWMGLFGPAAQQIMTRHVSPSEYGQLQGANMSLNGIAGIAGPYLFTGVFAYFIQPGKWHIPGAAFYLAAILCAAGFLVAEVVTRRLSALGDRNAA